MSNVTKCQMSRNVKCHKMSNVTKCQMSRNFKCFLYICICVAATVLWLHVRAALYLRLPHLMSSGHSAQPINHQTRSMTAVTHLSKQLCRRMQAFFQSFFLQHGMYFPPVLCSLSQYVHVSKTDKRAIIGVHFFLNGQSCF